MPENLFSASDRTRTLEGALEHVVYHNEENGWTVARLRVGGRPEPVTVVGVLGQVHPGERLRLTGTWERDARFGNQFRATGLEVLPPTTPEGIRRYLASGLVPGIGPELARRLTARFGADTLHVIESSPEKLRRVEGLGPKRVAAIRRAWTEHRSLRETLVFLQSHGVGTVQALRIHKRYGEETVDRVRENPFRLAHDIAGIGFHRADAIATALGCAPTEPQRLQSGLRHVLDTATTEGHCCLPRDLVRRRALRLLDLDAAHAGALDAALATLLEQGDLVEERRDGKTWIYPRRLFALEQMSALALASRLRRPPRPQPADLDDALRTFEREAGVTFADEQRQAVLRALTTDLLVITGGPGTGKTTLVRALVHLARAQHRDIVLGAPTGRAARRLAEATGHPAATLHRLLEWSPAHRRFERNADRPLEGDLFLVDETSMVDLPLLASYLQALPRGSALVLVGDADQLPSVGPGAVLFDLLEAGVPCVRLEKVFRQGEGSAIVDNSHRIRAGETPELPPPGTPGEFVFVDRQDPEALRATLVRLVGERLPASLGVDPLHDVQVLVPMQRGALGARELNRVLQAALNPDGEPVGPSGLRVGDKVMQVRNNYGLDVFNGDIGLLTSYDRETRVARVRFDDRSRAYEESDLLDLVPAYACTVHKAQGSEYAVVVLVLHTQHHIMLQRNLLYTAVTRARRQLVVLGAPEALQRAVRNARRQVRHTFLAQRIRAAVPESAGSGEAGG